MTVAMLNDVQLAVHCWLCKQYRVKSRFLSNPDRLAYKYYATRQSWLFTVDYRPDMLTIFFHTPSGVEIKTFCYANPDLFQKLTAHFEFANGFFPTMDHNRQFDSRHG